MLDYNILLAFENLDLSSRKPRVMLKIALLLKGHIFMGVLYEQSIVSGRILSKVLLTIN